MKRILYFMLIVSLLGCGKSGGDVSPESGTISFDINGRNVVFPAATTTRAAIATITDYVSFSIFGLKSNNESISLVFLNGIPKTLVGTYNDRVLGELTYLTTIVSGTSTGIGYGYRACNPKTSDFELQITDYNTTTKTVSGTFKGTVCSNTGDKQVITNGRFNSLPY